MTGKALAKAEEILELDTEPADCGPDGSYGPTVRAQTSVISTVLSTQAKVDENKLRRQAQDRLPSLLKTINEIAARLPATRPAPTIDLVPE